MQLAKRYSRFDWSIQTLLKFRWAIQFCIMILMNLKIPWYLPRSIQRVGAFVASKLACIILYATNGLFLMYLDRTNGCLVKLHIWQDNSIFQLVRILSWQNLLHGLPGSTCRCVGSDNYQFFLWCSHHCIAEWHTSGIFELSPGYSLLCKTEQGHAHGDLHWLVHWFKVCKVQYRNQ